MFDTDFSELDIVEKTLESYNEKALPYAIKDTLNWQAFQSQQNARRDLAKNFQIRNKYTEGSIRFNLIPRSEKNVNNMVSSAGSMQQYMADQHEGFKNTARGPGGVPIPTPATAGQTGTTRTKPRLRRLTIPKLKTQTFDKGSIDHSRFNQFSAAQELTVLALMMAQSKKKYVWARINSVYGLYELRGAKLTKGQRRGWPKPGKFVRLYSATVKTTEVKPTPWLIDAVEDTDREVIKKYHSNLLKQIRINQQIAQRKKGRR